MAVLDITNELEVEVVSTAVISTNTTTVTSGIDMANFDPGYVFVPAAYSYTDGNYVMTLEDSPDDVTYTPIPTDKLLDPAGAGSITLSAASVATNLLGRIGAFSTDRYVRASIVSTGVTSGAALTILAVKSPEETPA